MKTVFSIIYAHRNRDAQRIRKSFNSLTKQCLKNFEVIFVDYGSEAGLVEELMEVVEDFTFVSFNHLPVSQLLWNKSKALNYGIKKANGEYIFIADVDILFHPETTAMWQNLRNPEKFYLFRLGYLGKMESSKLSQDHEFGSLKSTHFSDVNGMVLSSRESLVTVNGLDEFFHFYGAEDEDLFARLENAGYEREQKAEKFFYHQWHQSFSSSEDRLLTETPRIKNIMRINQQHFNRNRDLNIIRPLRQGEMGKIVSQESSIRLNSPTLKFKIPNIRARVEHFLYEEIPALSDEIIQVNFFEDVHFNSLKHKIKKSLGKQTQTCISMKNLNDIVLKEILFKYRNSNYSFIVEKNSRIIEFKLEI